MTIRDYLFLLQRVRSEQPGTPVASLGPGAGSPGALDVVRSEGPFTLRVAGWVRDQPGVGTLTVRVIEGTRILAQVSATGRRTDVAANASGFDLSIRLLGGEHRVCVAAFSEADPPSTWVNLGCASAMVDSGAPADPLPADATWLQTLNHHRVSSGLAPISTEDVAWSAAILNHLVYLRDTPQSYFTGPYVNRHLENPASPFATAEGASRPSNLGGGSSQRDAMETWMRAPLHALTMLDPTANRAAFAMLGPPGLAGGGATSVSPGPARPSVPIMTPGNGSVTSLRRFDGEQPDPTEPCPQLSMGRRWSGLPLIVQLPYDTPVGVTAAMRLPDGSDLPASDLCVVTEHNATSSDPVYGYGMANVDDVVLVFPADPLTPGTHQVTVSVPGRPAIDWSFAVSRS